MKIFLYDSFKSLPGHDNPVLTPISEFFLDMGKYHYENLKEVTILAKDDTIWPLLLGLYRFESDLIAHVSITFEIGFHQMVKQGRFCVVITNRPPTFDEKELPIVYNEKGTLQVEIILDSIKDELTGEINNYPKQHDPEYWAKYFESAVRHKVTDTVLC